MNVRLDPEVAGTLERFGQRRRALIVRRGGLAAVTALLGALTLVGALDYALVLEDGLRLALSVVAYLGALAFVAWISWVRLWRRPDRRDLARLVERVQPELREELLSAVELAETGEGGRGEAEALHAAVQQRIATRMVGVTAAQLLPDGLLTRWRRAAFVTVVVVGGLLAVPGVHFWRLLARAALPTANLERVSRTRLAVVTPAPADAVVPQGDPLTIVVEQSGRLAETAWLETYRGGRAEGRVRMQPLADNRFQSTVDVARETLEYRVRSGDGLTRRYRLTAVARPQVTGIERRYRHPAYAQLPDRVERGPDGDLVALAGSTVELEMIVDRPVREAKLRVDTGQGIREVPLTSRGGDRVSGAMPMDAPGSYRVHLVAAETGFENTFSPAYEIRLLADLVPNVTIVQPRADMAVSPNERVDVVVNARDDLGLVSVTRSHRVNGGPWMATPLVESASGTSTNVEFNWDLLALELHTGDRVQMRVAALDRHGQQGESAVLQFTVSAPGFEPDRFKPVVATREVAAAVSRAKEAADALGRAAERAATAVGAQPEETAVRREEVLRLADAAARAEEANRAAGDAAIRARQAVSAGPLADELVAVAAALAASRRDTLMLGRGALEAVEQSSSPAQALVAAGTRLREAAARTQGIDEATGALAAREEAMLAARDVRALAQEQAGLNQRRAEDGAESGVRDGLDRRQQLALEHAQDIVSTLNQTARLAPGPQGAMASRMAERLQQVRDAETRRLGAGEAAGAEFTQELENTKKELNPLVEALVRKADAGRAALARQTGPVTAPLEQLVQAMEEAASTGTTAPAEAWAVAVEGLRDAAAHEELRGQADSQFVRDSENAAEAVEAMRQRTGVEVATASPADALSGVRELQAAYRAMAAAQAAGDAVAQVETMAAREQWESRAAEGAGARAEAWRPVGEALTALPETLKALGANEAVRAAVETATRRPEVGEVAAEMARRGAATESAANPVAAPLTRLGNELASAAAPLETAAAQARDTMARHAPSLSERLSGLAEAAADLQAASAGLGAAAMEQPGETTRTQAEALLRRQELLNDRLEAAQTGLRRDANVQDLSTAAGRERARDADDAAALLRQPPPRAEDHLRRAAAAAEAPVASGALQQAAEQQGRLADDLDLLARHYDRLETGQPEATRAALRASEESQGLKPALDAQYALSERLAGMQARAPAELMADLEHELAGHSAMRRALEAVSEEALGRAAADLAAADEKQGAVAGEVQALATQQQAQVAELTRRARQLAGDAAGLAEGELRALASEAQKAAGPHAGELAASVASLKAAAASVPQDLMAPNAALQEQMVGAAQGLQRARAQLEGAAEQARAQAAKAEAETGAARARLAAQTQEAEAVRARLTAARDALAAAQSNPAVAEPVQQHQAAVAQEEAALWKAESTRREAESAVASAQGIEQRIGGKATQDRLDAAGKSAAALTEEARQLAGALASMRKRNAETLGQAAGSQTQAAATANEAALELDRAGRHRQRLSLPDGESLQQLATRTAQTAAGEQTQAAAALAEAPRAVQAQGRVNAASQAVDARVAELAALRSDGARPAEAGSMPADVDAVGPWMARALDRLDQTGARAAAPTEQPAGLPPLPDALDEQAGPDSGAASPSQAPAMSGEIAQAMQQAAREHAQGLAAARARTPGAPSVTPAGDDSAAPVEPEAVGPGFVLPAELAAGDRDEDWGRLPRHVARDLMDGRREEVPEAYRAMVDSYFRVIAQRAREEAP